MWHATILTLYPELFPGPLGASILGRASAEGVWNLDTVNIRDFSDNRYGSVDDTPAGGGAGMVMRADILARALDHAQAIKGSAPHRPLIYLSPRGRPLTQDQVRRFSQEPGLIILCGRFEGVDQRLLDTRPLEEVSIGDFVLAGAEIAAMAMIEACVRLLPGVLGSAQSLDEESFEDFLLEYPHYTRPKDFEGLEIPAVLRSGDHQKIADWRHERAKEITRARRPDLYQRYCENGPIRRDTNKERET